MAAAGGGVREGVGLTLALCAAVSVLSLAVLGVWGTGEDGVRVWVHATARLGASLLIAVYVASTLRRVWRAPFSGWLLRNRRYVGLGFAYTHFVHLGSVIWLAEILERSGRDGYPPTIILVLTGIGYTLLVALVATSSDAAVARLGRETWSRLHTWTLHYLWFLFVFTFYGGATKRLGSALFLAALLAALGFRIWGRARGQGPAPVAP